MPAITPCRSQVFFSTPNNTFFNTYTETCSASASGSSSSSTSNHSADSAIPLLLPKHLISNNPHIPTCYAHSPIYPTSLRPPRRVRPSPSCSSLSLSLSVNPSPCTPTSSYLALRGLYAPSFNLSPRDRDQTQNQDHDHDTTSASTSTSTSSSPRSIKTSTCTNTNTSFPLESPSSTWIDAEGDIHHLQEDHSIAFDARRHRNLLDLSSDPLDLGWSIRQISPREERIRREFAEGVVPVRAGATEHGARGWKKIFGRGRR